MSQKDTDSIKQASGVKHLDQTQRIEKLEQIKQRYELALSVSPSGLWDLDISTNHLHTSPRLKELLGYGREEIEITMDDFWNLLHPEDLPRVKMAFEKHLKEHIKYHIEYRLAAKSGNYLWFLAIGQAVWNASGEATRMAGSITDITPRKKALEQSRQIESRYNLTVSGSDAGIWEYNPVTDKAYYSNRFKELIGLETDELENLSAEESWDYIHPDYREKAMHAMKDHLDGKTPFYYMEYQVRMKSGEYRWFQARGKASWDDNGQAINVAGSFIDIHEQKLAEEKIIRNERLFRSILDQSPLAMELLTPEGKIERYNPAWLKLWGVNELEAREIIGTYNMLSNPHFMEPGILDLVKRAFNGELIVLPPLQFSPANSTNKSGTQNVRLPEMPWIQCHLYPIKDESGTILYVVNTYMDITALKMARDDLQNEREMLAKIERSSLMGQLTASIAHELNQPLTGILGNAQAAKIYFNKNEYIEISDILDDIVHDSKRAGEVIRNLREVYQDQTGVFESIDLKSLVFNTIKLLNSELVGSQIRNEVIYEDEDLTITGNKVQIQQVLVNLIINAIESMSEQQRSHRKMVIAIKREKNMVQVYVEDSGTGLDEQLLPRIFEPFTSWKSGGTGMGLAISNNIVEAHGGHIWAVNTSDGGLRVGFDIPSGD